MNYNNYKAQQEIANYTIANYEKIKVKAGKCRYNFRCQYNSVHEAKKNKHKKLAMCIYLDDGYPIIHFINYNKGKFVDNTLGEWSSRVDFYFVRWISDEEMWQIDTIFTTFRKELRKTLSWWTRLTSDFDA
jgi:hypothetical protein